MRAMIVVAVLASGCAGFVSPFGHTTPPGEPPGMRIATHEVTYELLGHVIGEACAPVETTKLYQVKSADPRAIGSGMLFEQAKWSALGSLEVADGLIGLRAKVEYRNGQECISVYGRAYRITSIRAAECCRNEAAGAKAEAPKASAKPGRASEETLAPSDWR